MKIGFIGAGRVGFSIGKYLTESGLEVVGYYSKHYSSACEAAKFTKTCPFENLADLIDASDTLFVTVSDREIPSVWDCIVKYPIRNKIICHFSGSVSSAVFSDRRIYGAYGCSLHPMIAFNDKYNAYRLLKGSFCTIEGDQNALAVISELLLSLDISYKCISPDDKSKYHTAASIASNSVIALIQLSTELLCSCGFSEQESYRALESLAKHNLNSVFEKGTVQALTGPVERCDTDTVQKHISVLSGNDLALYKFLACRLVSLAERKNPDMDYTSIIQLLEHSPNNF